MGKAADAGMQFRMLNAEGPAVPRLVASDRPALGFRAPHLRKDTTG